MYHYEIRKVSERNQQNKHKRDVFSKNRKGVQIATRPSLGLPGGSNKRRCLLVEATQLGWATWAATTSLFYPTNRGKRVEQKGSALLVLRNLSKLVRKIIFVEKIQAKVLP